MEKQATKKRQIKLTWDEADVLSRRIVKDSFNFTKQTFFVSDLTSDDMDALGMDVLKLEQFVDALELLDPAYFKKLRNWLRAKRARANPNVESRADILTTMNVSKKNLWSLDDCVANYNHTHEGANINRDDMLALMIADYKFSNQIR